jgi:hypothetical protein
MRIPYNVANPVLLDTLDLQNQNAPSAQDHSNPHSLGSPLGAGPAAPHQQAALKHASDELSTEEKRLSQQWLDSGILNEELEDEDERAQAREAGRRVDELAISQNGGVSGDVEDDDMDPEDDADLDDDDMMDKVSSSPSIEDGGYIHFLSSKPLPPVPASERPSLSSRHKPLPILPGNPPTPPPEDMLCVASPLHLQTPNRIRLRVKPPTLDHVLQKVASRLPSLRSNSPMSSVSLSPYITSARDHHYLGEYTLATNIPDPFTDDTSDYADEARDILMPLPSEVVPEDSFSSSEEFYDIIEPGETGCYPRFYEDGRRNDSTSVLSSEDDPFVDGPPRPSLRPLISSSRSKLNPTTTNFSRRPPSPPDSTSSWESASDLDPMDLLSRYDDLEAFSFAEDDRAHPKCACGDDCLQDAEDIDFEFVYALHTFVATVEGQANAQKGDTMVLLDDSNSYWWLVRVVKDSSIGETYSFIPRYSEDMTDIDRLPSC